jgi:hypothetical protein
MDQYNLTVRGVDGTYVATLKFGTELVSEFEAADVKRAQKQARAEAIRHRDENRPSRLEVYTESFSL